ncbi:BatA domain-containing protein [Verrucomicrobiaceae bacterium 227]
MIFTAAHALWGLLVLAALPFLIHWLSRRSPKRFYFSSLDDLKKSLAGRSRLFKWRHFFFLLIRSLALIALVLAFLKPVIGLKDQNTNGRRHVILLIDQSLSMAHKDDNTSTWKRAQLESSKILRSLDPLDRMIPILVGRTPEAGFSQFSHNITAAESFINEARPQAMPADFKAANLMASQLAAKADGPVDFIYLSDFQRKNWASVQFKGLPDNANLFFVPATDDEARRNQAILEASLTGPSPTHGQNFEITAKIGNYSQDNYSGKIEVLVSGTLLADQVVSLPPWGEGEIRLQVPGLRSGTHAANVRLSPDDLPLDNEFWLPIEVRDTEQVIILSDGKGTENSTRFLKAAVNPFGEEKSGIYRVRELTGENFTPSSLSGSSKFIASKMPALTRGQSGGLATFLRSGGGALLFLDGTNDPGNLDHLSDVLGTALPLQLTTKLSGENLAGGAMKISEGDFRSPFLRLFKDERRRNLGFLEFYDLYHASATGKGRVLLRYADGTPALTETQAGLGTLLIANFSVGELSSNIARQSLFPGWIHDILGKLSPAKARENEYLVGDRIFSEAWTSESMGRNLLGPGESEIETEADIRGERVFFNFTAPAPGAYILPAADGRPLQTFAVNPTNHESDLRSLDPAILPTRSPENNRATILAGGIGLDEWADGLPAFHWFIFAALTLLTLESLLHLLLKKPKKKEAKS